MIRPLEDRVFLTPIPRVDTTEAGLHIPDTDTPETICDVFAVGSKVTAVVPGERVLIAPMSGIEATFNHGASRYIILGEDEILAVLS